MSNYILDGTTPFARKVKHNDLPTWLDPTQVIRATDMNALLDACSDLRNHVAGYVNVLDLGAKGDGVTDDSAAFISAATVALASGVSKGRVVVPAGRTYVVQGLPLSPGLYWEGFGATLKLPASPSNHMFLSSVDIATFVGGGVTGFELDGGGTTTCDAINFDSMRTGGTDGAQLHDFVVQDNYIHNFRRAFSGAQRDRWVPIINNRLWYNQVGIYIRQEHPNVGVNDIRSNVTGVGGSCIHVQFVGTKFNYNTYGVRGLDGGEIKESQFIGCHFWGNTSIGAQVQGDNRFEGCLIATNGRALEAWTTGGKTTTLSVVGCHIHDNSEGIFVSLSNPSIVGNTFDHQTSWDIRLDYQYGSPDGAKVSSNVFQRGGSSPAITVGATGTAVDTRLVSIVNNVFWLSVVTAQAFTTSKQWTHGLINDNTVYATAGHTATVFDLGTVNGGYEFSNNTCFAEGASTALVLSASASPRAVITSNRLRNFAAAPLSLGSYDTDTIVRDNFGFVTENAGTASIAAGATSVVVTHGLALIPLGRWIDVKWDGSPGAAKAFWVTNITSTQFTINVDAAPGGAGAALTWHASAVRH